ncbi:MAG: adenosylcobinamide-GDP ribazoletransferase [Euryarchaeota archaeon]|nr:adenosylcobinamide-GDP ribazoletransferase [Euryarchaeota archaeon]
MGFIREFGSLISFLTTIPIPNNRKLEEAAKLIWLFPVIGAFIGGIAGILGWILFQFFPTLVASIIILASLILVSGFNHLDGLSDFGDGIATVGDANKKIQAMHDIHVGVGGIIFVVFVLLSILICLSELSVKTILPALIISEVSAKLGMVTGATFGKPAHKGIGAFFVENATKLKFGVAVFISFLIGYLAFKIVGIIAVTIGIVVGFFILLVAHKQFNGVTGDVFGATNEFARLLTLIVLVGILKWL